MKSPGIKSSPAVDKNHEDVKTALRELQAEYTTYKKEKTQNEKYNSYHDFLLEHCMSLNLDYFNYVCL